MGKNKRRKLNVELYQALTGMGAYLDKVESNNRLLLGSPVQFEDIELSAMRAVYDMLQKRAANPQDISFSTATANNLAKFGLDANLPIKLALKPDLADVVAQSDALGRG